MKHVFLAGLCLGFLLSARGPIDSWGGNGGDNKAHGALYARAEGADVKVVLEIRIDRDWHLYHGPTEKDMSPDGGIGKPTVVTLKAPNVAWSSVEYPKPEFVEQKISDDEPASHIGEYHGTAVFRAIGHGTGTIDPNSVTASVVGLTCVDDGTCVPYAEDLKVEGPGPDALFAKPDAAALASPTTKPIDRPPVAVDPTPAKIPAVASTPGSKAAAAASKAAVIPDTSLLAFLISAVLWGLFTLLMPCTYPMIPITISYFTKQATQRESGTFALSVAYGAGIVLVFVLIGVLIGPLIIPFATAPGTNLVIGGFFILFALSLFGVVDLQPPSFLLNAAGQASTKGGFAGVFLMGATLVVTSFTCTAPFVGTLLSTGASSGNLGRVALGMAVFGLTMAIPFMALSMVPGKVKALPRSGEWMHTLKVTLGFVEIAASLKFISNVDLVWGWGFLSRELFLFFWMAIFVVAALYLFGLIRLQGETTHEISPGRMLAGLLFALFSFYCAYGAVGNTMDPIMTAIIPPYSNASGGGAKSAAADKHTIVKDDYEAALALARDQGKRLLVNFTGIT
jgi:thiol:disulfide interchange protein DsbD